MSNSCNVDDNIYRLPVDLEDTHVSEIGLKGRKQAQMDNLTQEHITHSGVRSGLKAHGDWGVLQEETSTAHPTPHGSMWPPTSCAQHHQVSQAAKGTHFQPKSSYWSSKDQKIMGLGHHVGHWWGLHINTRLLTKAKLHQTAILDAEEAFFL